MTHFMAYVILLSAAIGAASMVAELVLRTRTRSTRWIWLGALGAVLFVAGTATFVSPAALETPVPEVSPVNVDGISASPITVVVTEARSDSVLRFMDAMLPAAWAIASAMLLLAILYGQRRLASERRASSLVRIRGREVLLTETVGPAVAGVGSPFVLMPRWALALDATSQELLLAHEFEHVQRGDTRILLTGAVAVALMPWNPVVWWINRRLRLAVERDCDARVLATHPDVRRYADLLLTAASRHGVSTRLLAAHFGEYHSDLEARIRTMTDKRLKWRTALATATVAVALIVMSCEAPRPEPIAPLEQTSTEPKQLVSPRDVLSESQVEKPATAAVGSLSPRYPEILRQAGVEGEVLVSFVVDENGTADPATLKVVRATHELFATAVKNALPTMRFNPAEVGGKKVKQLVEQPFSFTLPGTKTAASREELTVGQLEAVAVEGKKLAFTLRRQDAVAEEPNVVVYAFDGTELARSERDANLLRKIAPQSIHSIEVFKPRSCPATMTCPLIKITLAKDQSLGSATLVRPTRGENTTEARATGAEKKMAYRVNRSDLMSSPMNFELLDSRGEVVARYGSRAEVRMVNSEDISASRTYSAKECAAMTGVACPLTRIWFKPGREGAYRKR